MKPAKNVRTKKSIKKSAVELRKIWLDLLYRHITISSVIDS